MSGALSVESCIEMMRAALARIEIAERDVKVTWDTPADWARFRARLPSGRIVDRTVRHVGKVPRDARASDMALTTLARWLRDLAKTHPADLDVAFADHLTAEAARRKADADEASALETYARIGGAMLAATPDVMRALEALVPRGRV